MASFRPLRAKGAVFLCLFAGLMAMACTPSPKVNLDLDSEVLSLATNSKKLPASIEEKNTNDTIAGYYKNFGTKKSVVDFFSSLTNSTPIAVAILDNAVNHQVPASLAFAIAYEESRFNPKALNKNDTTVDRGLFQLNSLTFPQMSDTESLRPLPQCQGRHKVFQAYPGSVGERGICSRDVQRGKDESIATRRPCHNPRLHFPDSQLREEHQQSFHRESCGREINARENQDGNADGSRDRSPLRYPSRLPPFREFLPSAKIGA